ncbi:MAG: hypothetical protein EOO73_08855 [Myxococcales bacterium]|nr:MAG: hypothetical protein EOO73_08855 [Myxococcales bacterium]
MLVPATRCLLPFEAGNCDANFQVFAFIEGQCVPATYGGCGGNDNRFATVEECIDSCEGRPSVNPCSDGRVAKEICVQCGNAGGCARTEILCSVPCDAALPDECAAPLTCISGYCQAGPCL